MPRVNHNILVWARETAGFTPEQAVKKLEIKDARGVAALERLTALEKGQEEPGRPLLTKMAKQYRRPLVTFYMSMPPKRGDRGQDFRTLPADHSRAADALLDALLRDIRARQNLVRAALEDEEDNAPHRFINSAKMADGATVVLDSIRRTIGVDLLDFRKQGSSEEAFALLRNRVEAVGIFVLLIGNLGSHHTAIDVETFRGFALADPIAPFIVINDQDAKSAWSFTLVHELAHLWLGASGVSGASAEMAIEQFCNDIAGEFLLPAHELVGLDIDDDTDLDTAILEITDFANARLISRSMVAYKLHRTKRISRDTWQRLSTSFRDQWLHDRAARRERDKQEEGGPNYYVVRRHRLGTALLDVVRRAMSDGILTPSKAGKILGVKPRNVAPLLHAGGPFGPADGAPPVPPAPAG